MKQNNYLVKFEKKRRKAISNGEHMLSMWFSAKQADIVTEFVSWLNDNKYTVRITRAYFTDSYTLQIFWNGTEKNTKL